MALTEAEFAFINRFTLEGFSDHFRFIRIERARS